MASGGRGNPENGLKSTRKSTRNKGNILENYDEFQLNLFREVSGNRHVQKSLVLPQPTSAKLGGNRVSVSEVTDTRNESNDEEEELDVWKECHDESESESDSNTTTHSEQGENRGSTTQNSDRSSTKFEIFPDCKLTVAEDDSALQCEVCVYWFHISCQGVSENMYQALSEENASDQFSWHCNYCKRGAKALMGHITTIHAKQIKTDRRLGKVEKRVMKLENNAGKHEITDELK